MEASPSAQLLRSPPGSRVPKWRRQQRHIYLEVMGATPLKFVLLTMIVTAVGCMVLSVMQSKNLSEIVGDNEVCITQLNGLQLCIQQFEALNCTPPNATVGVPPSVFDGNMRGISPYNGYFTIDTRFISPNSNTTSAARTGVFPTLTYNITVIGSDGGSRAARDVVFKATRQIYSLRCYYDGYACQPVTAYITNFPLNYSAYSVHLEFEENLCTWGNNMEVTFGVLNADWGFAHLIINSVSFAFSVVLALFVHPANYSRATAIHIFCMYWIWSFRVPGKGLLGAFLHMLPEQKCITFALVALVLLNQPQTVFNKNYLYYYEGQVAQLVIYCLAIATFLTFWLVIIDVMSKQNPTFATFRSGFWIYKSLFFIVFFGAHFARLFFVLGFERKESGAQNSQSNPDAFEKLGGWSFACFIMIALVWFVWWIKSVRKCSRSLKSLPYLSTRYRQLSFSFFVWLSLWLGLFMLTSYTYAFTQLDEKFFYASSRDYNDSAQMVIITIYFSIVVLAFLPAKKGSGHHAPVRHKDQVVGALQDSLLESRQSAFHPHSDVDAEASFVVWEHEKEALQARLSQRRESMFSHANIRGAGGHITLRSLAEFLRDVATEAFVAAFSLFKNLPSVLLHLVVGQETRLFCVETALIAAHVADLSYYDPEGVKTESGFGELKNRAILGSSQHVVGFFSCAQTDSHCLLLIVLAASADSSIRYESWGSVMQVGGPKAARSSVNRLWVSFRGTASLKGLIKDFKAHPVPMDAHFAAVNPHENLLSILRHIPLMLQGCKVHVGFYETYKSISDDVLGCVMQHLALYPGTEVICTGHSMGGACAVHCAVDLRVRLGPSHPIQVYSFGAPRVGNHKYARMYDLFVPETYRVVYNQDVVVTVPKFLFYYKHVGVEVMLDQVGNLVVGPTFVERVFRPGRRSFLDHRLINYCNGLQVALLADDTFDDDYQGRDPVPDAPPDVVIESGVKFPRMNQFDAVQEAVEALHRDGGTSPIGRSFSPGAPQRRKPADATLPQPSFK